MKIPILPLCLWAVVALCSPTRAAPQHYGIDEPRIITEGQNEIGDPRPRPPDPLPVPPPRPLVVWHGLGDQYSSAGMLDFAELIKEIHKGIFVYLVRISDVPSDDQKAGWFGNVNEQIAKVAEDFANIEELQNGFDAIGFSQGGQFLRAYVERYNNPPIRNLITFGSQHMGISDIPGCKPMDFLCRAAKSAARSGMYTSWAQKNLVQAQYFRDHNHFDAYLSSNHFLPDINNEVFEDDDSSSTRSYNSTYFDNLVSLDNLVMVLFDQDRTVVPKESSWFGSYAIPTDDDRNNDVPDIIDMRDHPLYQEDWIGLRTLDEEGKLFELVCEGEHMVLKDECWRPIVKKWCGQVDLDIPDPTSQSNVLEIPPLLLQDW